MLVKKHFFLSSNTFWQISETSEDTEDNSRESSPFVEQVDPQAFGEEEKEKALQKRR